MKLVKAVELPENFVKGLIVDVSVSKDGKSNTKRLKVCTAKVRSIIFIEVDRDNKKNIFRKVSRKDIVDFRPTAVCSIKIRDGVLPVKWESEWGSQFVSKQMNNVRAVYSNHSKGWSSNAPQYRSTTNNPVSGFPMV
jgi:hypothetical protein